MRVRKGDKFVQHHPEARWPVFIEVTRVSPTGWVDIRCYTWAVSWGKRMRLGLDKWIDSGNEFGITRRDWTPEEVRATEPQSLDGAAFRVGGLA